MDYAIQEKTMRHRILILCLIFFASLASSCSLFGTKINNATNTVVRSTATSHAALTPNLDEARRQDSVEMERARSEALLHTTVESGSTKGLHRDDAERLEGRNWVLKSFELSEADLANEMAKNKLIAENLGDDPSNVELFRAEAYYVYLLSLDFSAGKQLGLPTYLRVRDQLEFLSKKFEKMHEYDPSRYGSNSVAGYWSRGKWVALPPEVYKNLFLVYEETKEYKKAMSDIDDIETIHPATHFPGSRRDSFTMNPTDDRIYLAKRWFKSGGRDFYEVGDEAYQGKNMYDFLDELNKMLAYEVPNRGGSNIDETFKKLTKDCNGDKYCESHFLRGILKSREQWYLETKPMGLKVNTIVDGICQGSLSNLQSLPKDDAELYTAELKGYYDALDDIYKKADDETPLGSYEFNWGNGVRSAAEITQVKKDAVAALADETQVKMPSNTKDASIEKYIKDYVAQYTKAKVIKITVENKEWGIEIDERTLNKLPKGRYKTVYYFVEDPEHKGTVLMGPRLVVVENYNTGNKTYGGRRVDIHGVYRKVTPEDLADIGNRCIYRVVTDYKK